MKKNILIILTTMCFLMSGCGVSQSDYDDLQSKYNSLQTEYSNVKENYDNMVEEKSKKVDSDMALSYSKAWATTYFGDDCLIMFSDNNEYLQIICKKEYSATSDTVKDIYKTVLSSMKGLGTYINEINQDRIAVKFEQTRNKELLEFVFKRDNGSYVLESTNGDLQNAIILIQGLNNVSK